MFVAALIVLVIAVLLLLVGLLGGGQATTMDFGWFNLDANVTVVFVLGMVCLALFGASWRMFRSGTRHAMRSRRDRRRITELNSQVAELRKDRDGSPDGAETDATTKAAPTGKIAETRPDGEPETGADGRS